LGCSNKHVTETHWVCEIDMRPGKLFAPTDFPIQLVSVNCFDNTRRRPRRSYNSIGVGELFFVVSVELDEKLHKAANYHDLKSPWLVLYKEKVWLAETFNKSMVDLTPWAPWDKNCKHNDSLKRAFRHFVKPCND